VRWFRKAADAHFGPALANLALMYSQGRGVTADAASATRYYEAAAADGFVAAMEPLGFRYADGVGVARDAKLAIKWLERAANTGSTTAIAKLTALLEQEGSSGDEVARAKASYWRARVGEMKAVSSQTGEAHR